MTDPLHSFGEDLVKRIQQEFDNKNLNDRGGASGSLEFSVEGEKVVVYGLARVLFLEFGRRPGDPPPFDVIQGWVERKLNVPAEEVDSVAWAIVKKIAKEGTSILTDKAKGLELEIILADLLEEFTQYYVSFKAESIVNGLVKTWQSH